MDTRRQGRGGAELRPNTRINGRTQQEALALYGSRESSYAKVDTGWLVDALLELDG